MSGVGPVAAQTAHFTQPLALKGGCLLPAFDLVYETYGTLNAAKCNKPSPLKSRSFNRVTPSLAL
jgi:homoserine O-acetyltransferase